MVSSHILDRNATRVVRSVPKTMPKLKVARHDQQQLQMLDLAPAGEQLLGSGAFQNCATTDCFQDALVRHAHLWCEQLRAAGWHNVDRLFAKRLPTSSERLPDWQYRHCFADARGGSNCGFVSSSSLKDPRKWRFHWFLQEDTASGLQRWHRLQPGFFQFSAAHLRLGNCACLSHMAAGQGHSTAP